MNLYRVFVVANEYNEATADFRLKAETCIVIQCRLKRLRPVAAYEDRHRACYSGWCWYSGAEVTFVWRFR